MTALGDACLGSAVSDLAAALEAMIAHAESMATLLAYMRSATLPATTSSAMQRQLRRRPQSRPRCPR